MPKSPMMKPVHPGEVLKEEFLEPMGISTYRLAKAIHVTPIRISQVIRGKRAVTADTALRLAQYFGVTAEFWMGLQAQYDLQVARDLRGEAIGKEVIAYNKAG